jgi:hypothetical protein
MPPSRPLPPAPARPAPAMTSGAAMANTPASALVRAGRVFVALQGQERGGAPPRRHAPVPHGAVRQRAWRGVRLGGAARGAGHLSAVPAPTGASLAPRGQARHPVPHLATVARSKATQMAPA